jgi:hypothetical protein
LEVSVFPNPAKDRLSIQIYGVGTNAAISLMDLNGKELTSTSFKGDGTLDLMNYSPGMYILRVQTAKGVVTKKIIKE